MMNPDKKYNLEYYMKCVDRIVNMGAHILGIKDSELPQRSLFDNSLLTMIQWLVC